MAPIANMPAMISAAPVRMETVSDHMTYLSYEA
jgi:hypothetical protein